MAFLVGLTIVPAFAETQASSPAVVLNVADAQVLAFGPVYVAETFSPEQPGTAIITLHQDTHFNFLESIKIGDYISFGSETGKPESVFTVSDIRIADGKSANMFDVTDSPPAGLALITFYTDDGGLEESIRYLVFTDAMDKV